MNISYNEKREFMRYLLAYNFTPYIKDKTFLITGSKGLVGTGVIKWLLLENEVNNTNVTIIASTRNPEKRPVYLTSNDKVEFCLFGNEAEFVKNRDIDYIVHAVSPTGNSFHAVHPVESLRIIIDKTEDMLEIAKEKKAHMIYLSSEEVYGLPNSEKQIAEDYVGAVDSLRIRSCYPLGKKAAELLCFTYSEEYKVDVKIIRPTVIHGLLQPYTEERVVNEILRCIIENRNLVMKSAGLTKKCLMYSLDAISAIFGSSLR